jgi:hypothetical protein
MSLLTIVQAIAEEVGVTAPSLVIGSQDRTAKQLLRLVNRAGKVLAEKPWTILQKEHTFTTVASTDSYALPDDFGFMLDGTCWDRDNYWKARGGVSPQEWQVYKSGLVASASARKRFRIKASSGARMFFLDPTPDDAYDFVFEYVSNGWVANAANDSWANKFNSDSDTSLIPEQLIELSGIWRFMSKKGLDYEEEFNEYERMVDSVFSTDRVASIINLGGAPITSILMNLPEGNFPDA